MNTINLASQLANAYIERSERKLDLEQLEGELYKREVALTPVEGWDGKNAEQRELSKVRALASDETYQAILKTAQSQRENLSLLAGTIEALEAERRGVEWDIRQNLVTVMAGKLRGETSASVEDAAFDDAAGREMDDQIFEAMEGAADEAIFAGGPYPNGKPDWSEFHPSSTPSATYEMLKPAEEELDF